MKIVIICVLVLIIISVVTTRVLTIKILMLAQRITQLGREFILSLFN